MTPSSAVAQNHRHTPVNINLGKCCRNASDSQTLLVVEDDLALRQMLVWELSELGYGVYAVGSCREARGVAAERVLDLALLDVDLPDGTGTELASELSRGQPNLRVVLCSGRHGGQNQGEISPAVIARLTKPIAVHRLDALLRARN